ncbi:cytochrome-c oxidase, cbb3-type subunit III [Phenylobacterium sp. LjRoot219]|uniref:cytochrome-c oxidase, cbb3-type subunit III n=1 Tax=Phenylobacterium sp. LjRoot219 TaxID=3342283 RepID=UPI003ECD37DD
MSDRKIDEVTGVETTEHEWDGIRELDNPLPRWWLVVMWASVAVAAVYWLLMPAWPGIHDYTKGLLGKSDRAQLAQELRQLQAVRGQGAARLTNASLEQIEQDPELQSYALALGGSVFGDNCATCHGTGGTGGKGYANLRDDVWLWGSGTLSEVEHTITHGVRTADPDTRQSQMPAFGRDGMLNPGQIKDLTEYVVALSRRPADTAAAGRAAPLFQEQCAACHGANGAGDPTKGAPNLTDAEWLYGSSRDDIRGQIHAGRGGVMPSWGTRLSPETIKALTVYIHANAGGR